MRRRADQQIRLDRVYFYRLDTASPTMFRRKFVIVSTLVSQSTDA